MDRRVNRQSVKETRSRQFVSRQVMKVAKSQEYKSDFLVRVIAFRSIELQSAYLPIEKRLGFDGNVRGSFSSIAISRKPGHRTIINGLSPSRAVEARRRPQHEFQIATNRIPWLV